MNWENRCQKQIEIGVTCGDKPWIQADGCKAVSRLYLIRGTEWRQNICTRNFHLNMDTLTTVELWKITEDSFICPRNITFDRYKVLTIKRSQGESIEHFFGKLMKLSKNCELVNQEETLIRDLFIANMQETEIQKELLRKTVEPAQTLRLAISMELLQRNQIQFLSNQPALHVNAITPQRLFRNPSQQIFQPQFGKQTNCVETVVLLGQQFTRINFLQNAKHATTLFYKIFSLVYVANQNLLPPNHPDPI